MKKLILIIASLLSGLLAFGQKALDEYAYNADAQVFKWDEKTKQPILEGTYYRAIVGYRFILREHYPASAQHKSGWRIKFVPFKHNQQVATTDQQQTQIQQIENAEKKAKLQQKFNTALAAANNATQNGAITIIGENENDMPFFIADDDLTAKSTTDFRKQNSLVKIDGVVLPIKLRFKNNQPGGIFDFTQSISVGPVVSFTHYYGGPFGINSGSFLFGVNITNVPVDEKTVPGVITSKTTLLGLSPVIGFSLQYKGVSFGLMSGIDILTGDAGDKWAYRKSPWLGLSIGTSLTSIVSTPQSQTPKPAGQ